MKARNHLQKWAEIDLDAIESNFANLKKVIGSAVRLMGIVKADAYGHGALEVAALLESLGIHSLGVATVEEAVLLRSKGIVSPILVLTGVQPSEFEIMREAKLTPVVHERLVADALSQFGEEKKTKIPIHLKFNTGMNRLGISSFDALATFKRLQALPGIKLEGLLTHLACADDEKGEMTQRQLAIFLRVVNLAKEVGLECSYVHIASSAAVLSGYGYRPPFNMVRLGISLYGISPLDREISMPLKPALKIKSRILALQRVGEGEGVSYGATYRTNRKSVLAVIPFGYADGYSRARGESFVLVRGKRATVVGNICMDMMLADVTDIAQVSIGDEVVIVGGQGSEEIPVSALARTFGTVSYEVLCRLTSRLPKIFISRRGYDTE